MELVINVPAVPHSTRPAISLSSSWIAGYPWAAAALGDWSKQKRIYPSIHYGEEAVILIYTLCIPAAKKKEQN